MIEKIRTDELVSDGYTNDCFFATKMNEIIQAVNDLLLVHPKLQERLKFRNDIADEQSRITGTESDNNR